MLMLVIVLRQVHRAPVVPVAPVHHRAAICAAPHTHTHHPPACRAAWTSGAARPRRAAPPSGSASAASSSRCWSQGTQRTSRQPSTTSGERGSILLRVACCSGQHAVPQRACMLARSCLHTPACDAPTMIGYTHVVRCHTPDAAGHTCHLQHPHNSSSLPSPALTSLTLTLPCPAAMQRQAGRPQQQRGSVLRCVPRQGQRGPGLC